MTDLLTRAAELAERLPRADVIALSQAALAGRPGVRALRPCGPDAGPGTGRLTAAVVVGLIGEATKEIQLVGCAAHSEPTVEQALTDAVSRGVEVTLVLERAVDNPAYTFSGPVFPGLQARRLHWPASHRPSGASLHAKVIVVDRKTALVGSANLTSWAMERNLECGLLIRGGDQPRSIHRHIEGLVEAGVLSHS